ncbi:MULTISPECIES: CoA transferase [Pseudonocardia]|uniref:CoA transferase n=1 Tax=Pseudonocardia TaxID=1847 RepID=UPI0027E2C3E6|nr:CoA transferase [Pseudonocardia abyssalis]
MGVQNDRGWRALVCDVLGSPALADDPRFATNIDRVRHRAQCDAALAAHTAGWTTAALEERLAAAGIPAAQINTTAQMVEHPQLRERDRWRTVATEAGDIRGLLPPMTFRDIELPMGAVPALGEHNDRILDELGLPPEGGRTDGSAGREPTADVDPDTAERTCSELLQ